jgi:peptidoglycan/LPS O-acetylase OafA/YrhL
LPNPDHGDIELMNASLVGTDKATISVDRTSSGKEHFEVLGGLRGSAAFLIVIFHLFNYSFGFRGPWALVKHAYLAVDFFFALSGFVVAYAYDDRWKKMTTLPVRSRLSAI